MATNPHIYVSSVHGTNTGTSDTSYASQQTGNITSLTAGNVYTNLYAAVAGCSPSDGDTIYVCDNSAGTAALGTVNLNSGGTYNSTGLIIVSVDNTAIDSYLAGATDACTAWGNGYLFSNTCAVYGVSFSCNGDAVRVGGGTLSLHDLTITNTNNDIIINAYFDGSYIRMFNVDIVNNSVGNGMSCSNGCRIEWYGGSWSGSATTTNLMVGFATGGGHYYLEGVNLTSANFTNLYIAMSGVNYDNASIRLVNCTMPSGLTFNTIDHIKQSFEMIGCDDTTGDLLHRFRKETGAGIAYNNDSVYVTGGQPYFEGSAKSSIQIITKSGCSKLKPFSFELLTKYIDLSQAASDVVTVNLVTNMTLTDADIAAFMVYPDDTTAVQGNIVNSGQTILGTGTTLSTSALGAADWTGEPASPNFYKLELDTSGDAGQAFACSVRIEVYNATIDGTTNKLYIDTELATS